MGPLVQQSVATGWSCTGADLALNLRAPLDQNGYYGVMVVYIEDITELSTEIAKSSHWLRARSSAQLLSEALQGWRDWRTTPAVKFANEEEQHVWRQSEAVLRMGQVREPNKYDNSHPVATQPIRTSNGMMLASLSPGSWATGWVRDATYSTVAWARSGHFAEARDSLNFFLNAAPVGEYKMYLGNYDYRISVTRYFGSGEEEADYSEQATPNVETDGWGLVLWAARQYVQDSKDLDWLNSQTAYGKVYDVLKAGVAGAIESQLEDAPNRIMKPDSSIWEVHQQNDKHFAYTTQAAARGLCDFAAIANRSGHKEDHDHYAALARDVKAAYLKSFMAPEGYILGAVERAPMTDLDGSVVEGFNFNLLSPDLSVAESSATLKHLEELANRSGGFKRLAGTESFDTDEWIFIDFRMASAYLRLGQKDKADALIDRLTARASLNADLLPEMCNAQESAGPLGQYKGSNPMVGYGAGTYLLTLLDREGRLEDPSCD